MDESYLITGNYTPLNQSLVQEILKRDTPVRATVDRKNDEVMYENISNDSLVLETHDRRSPFSARALFMHAENRGCDLANICILYGINGSTEVLQDRSGGYIEERVDNDVKGLLFVVKEALMYLDRKAGGSLNFIIHNQGPEIPGPSDALVAGAFENLAESIFAYYGSEAYTVRGFTSRSDDMAQYAEYIYQTIETGAGANRWNQLKSRGTFFGLTRN